MITEIKEDRMTPQWMSLLEPFIGKDGNDFAIRKEKAIEANIIKMLEELGIKGIVKSDRYSLPAQGVVSSSCGYDSYISAIFDSSTVKREFLKVLLENDCRKVRFYVYIDTTEISEISPSLKQYFNMRFNIHIRYYLH